MENLKKQNESLKSLFKFWRAATLFVALISATCIVAMAGTISGLRAAAESADKAYRERIETETRLRDRSVREMSKMALRLADIEKEATVEQQEVIAVALADAGPELEYIGEFTITAYCCEKYDHICGSGDGLTATGIPVEPGIVAVDPTVIELGSRIVIDGQEYLAADTGGAIKGFRCDICTTTHDIALSYGVQKHDVYIVSGGEHD